MEPSEFHTITQLKIPIVIGTEPLNQTDPVNVTLRSYHACCFGPCVPLMAHVERPKEKGEMIESNKNSFVPLYTFYPQI